MKLQSISIKIKKIAQKKKFGELGTIWGGVIIILQLIIDNARSDLKVAQVTVSNSYYNIFE